MLFVIRSLFCRHKEVFFAMAKSHNVYELVSSCVIQVFAVDLFTEESRHITEPHSSRQNLNLEFGSVTQL